MAVKDTGGGQQRASKRAEEAEDTADAAPAEGVKERHDKLTDDVDSLLDDIDEALEENAEEFVRGYVQKGGE